MSSKGMSYFHSLFHNAGSLCRGDKQLLVLWVTKTRSDSFLLSLIFITIGCAVYGAVIGCRQGWEMTCYVALKLPAIIFLTLLVNGLLNGFLGLVLGSEIGIRHSFRFLLTGFSVMGVILLVLSPVVIFISFNLPAPGSEEAVSGHAATLLLHITVIAVAGILAHFRLLSCLRQFSATPRAGTRTFLAWLLGNLFVGAQISWNLRPFFVSPGLEIEFLRLDSFDGNFYESAFRALQNLSLF